MPLYVDRLHNSLLNPNQLHANGLQVDDIPRQFDPKSTHSIRWKDTSDVIPLNLRGVISGFPCRKPTQEEWRDCHRLELTSDEEWDPTSPDFAEREEKIAPVTVAALAQICEFDARVSDDHSGDRFISAMARDQDRQQLTELGGDDLFHRFVAQVTVASEDVDLSVP